MSSSSMTMAYRVSVTLACLFWTLLSCLANAIILVISGRQLKRASVHLFLFSLAIMDLCHSLFILPLSVAVKTWCWRRQSLLEVGLVVAEDALSLTYALLLLLIAVDRFLSLCLLPPTRCRPTTYSISIVASFLLAFLLASIHQMLSAQQQAVSLRSLANSSISSSSSISEAMSHIMENLTSASAPPPAPTQFYFHIFLIIIYILLVGTVILLYAIIFINMLWRKFRWHRHWRDQWKSELRMTEKPDHDVQEEDLEPSVEDWQMTDLIHPHYEPLNEEDENVPDVAAGAATEVKMHTPTTTRSSLVPPPMQTNFSHYAQLARRRSQCLSVDELSPYMIRYMPLSRRFSQAQQCKVQPQPPPSHRASTTPGCAHSRSSSISQTPNHFTSITTSERQRPSIVIAERSQSVSRYQLIPPEVMLQPRYSLASLRSSFLNSRHHQHQLLTSAQIHRSSLLLMAHPHTEFIPCTESFMDSADLEDPPAPATFNILKATPRRSSARVGLSLLSRMSFIGDPLRRRWSAYSIFATRKHHSPQLHSLRTLFLATLAHLFLMAPLFLYRLFFASDHLTQSYVLALSSTDSGSQTEANHTDSWFWLHYEIVFHLFFHLHMLMNAVLYLLFDPVFRSELVRLNTQVRW